MFVIRIALLLLLLAGLASLLLQNWFPVLGLVFLGMKSQSLPLAIWLLASVTAGGLTSLVIASLFKISNFAAARQARQNIKAQRTSTYRATPAADNRRPQVETETSTEASDWDVNDRDWDWDEEADETRTSSPQDQVRESTYESKQEPKSSYRSGSVYSYGYREPKDTGVGKTEAVYEADYRVITPPYQEPSVEAEDWGFEDEDEFEGEDEK